MEKKDYRTKYDCYDCLHYDRRKRVCEIEVYKTRCPILDANKNMNKKRRK